MSKIYKRDWDTVSSMKLEALIRRRLLMLSHTSYPNLVVSDKCAGWVDEILFLVNLLTHRASTDDHLFNKQAGENGEDERGASTEVIGFKHEPEEDDQDE